MIRLNWIHQHCLEIGTQNHPSNSKLPSQLRTILRTQQKASKLKTTFQISYSKRQFRLKNHPIDLNPPPGSKLSSLLLAATKLWPRLCFYTCVWFCSQGGVSGQGEPLPNGELPPGPDTPPGMETPCGMETPPGSRPPRGSRRLHTVNERPVRILLECILVQSSNHLPYSKLTTILLAQKSNLD